MDGATVCNVKLHRNLFGLYGQALLAMEVTGLASGISFQNFPP